MTIVLISGNFDLSIGATGALAAGVTLMTLNHASVWVAVLVGLGIGTLVGLVNGLLVQMVGTDVRSLSRLALTQWRGVLLILTNGESIVTSKTGFNSLVDGPAPLNLRWASSVAVGVVVVVGLYMIKRTQGTCSARSTSARPEPCSRALPS